MDVVVRRLRNWLELRDLHNNKLTPYILNALDSELERGRGVGYNFNRLRRDV